MNPKIVVIDDMHPEDVAMLQALYSRSAESVTTHLDKVKQSGSGKFMERYYVGYGHKSIADCGSTTIFIENVSMLAAKAIQDWPLYSGQETSTRYLDMSKRDMIDPIDTPESRSILARWMDFYVSKREAIANEVRRRFPQQPNESESAYEQAVNARSFDILRGFLPAACTTQLSWHTNLRQADDHLRDLTKHPLDEVVDRADDIRREFAKKYRTTFGHSAGVSGVGVPHGTQTERLARMRWEQTVKVRFTYAFDSHPRSFFRSWIDLGTDEDRREMIATRPRGCVLPHLLGALGQLQFCGLLDFGSFRDIQRHRNGVCKMPLLTSHFGFEPWYLEQLDLNTQAEAVELIQEQRSAIRNLETTPDIAQYYHAMGFRVQVDLTYALPAAVYVMELRSGKTVHPTLRSFIHSMIAEFRKMHPSIALHVDMDPDSWTVRRGTQTIVEKV